MLSISIVGSALSFDYVASWCGSNRGYCAFNTFMGVCRAEKKFPVLDLAVLGFICLLS